MGHRIYSESTTSEVLKDNGRTGEDYYVLCRFWPKAIAKIIAKVYSNSADLSFVEGMTSLTYLDVSDNYITDLSPLEGLEHLEVAFTQENPVL